MGFVSKSLHRLSPWMAGFGALVFLCPQALAAGESAFAKLCENGNAQSGCTTLYEFVETRTRTVVMSLSVQRREHGEGERLAITVQLGMMLSPGILIKIDENPNVNMRFTSCHVQGCVAETDLTPDLMRQMRTGTLLKVGVLNAANKTIGFKVLLADFARVHDGPPLDPKIHQDARRRVAPNAGPRVKPPPPPRSWDWGWAGYMQPQNLGQAQEWIKLCEITSVGAGPKKVCLIHHERIDGISGSVLNSMAIRQIAGQDKEQLMALVPLGVALEPGIQLKIDETEPVKLRFTICHLTGCVAETEAPPALVAQLRNARQSTVASISMSGKASHMPLPLSGFAKAYDGPPMDSAKYTAARKALLDAIRKRRRDFRRVPPPPPPPAVQEWTL